MVTCVCFEWISAGYSGRISFRLLASHNLFTYIDMASVSLVVSVAAIFVVILRYCERCLATRMTTRIKDMSNFL